MEKDTHLTDNDGEQPRDNFYHGVISKIFWSNETGVIHSDSGKEVPFIFAFVTLLGAPRQDINFLRPGMRVGFDVGWTSKGLRASTIKIYDLYQDDIVPERGNGPSYSSEVDVSAADHPISRYRPQEMQDTAEPPRYRQRRPRPRPQSQEQRSQEQNPQYIQPPGQEQSSDTRKREQQQNGSDTRISGQEQRRVESRPQGQEQRRPDPRRQQQGQTRADVRQQGQRREDPPRSSTHQNAGPPEATRANMTEQQPNERSQRSRRRRGRR